MVFGTTKPFHLMYDYLVIGQGLAGTILTERLHRLGKSFLVIDEPTQPSSSQAAGGMFNPVTGKALTKTWLADTLFPFLESYYRDLENRWESVFFYPIPLFRPFVHEAQKKQFLTILESEDLSDYITYQDTPTELTSSIQAPLGGLITHKTGWVDVPVFLACWRSFLQSNQLLREESFDWSAIEWGESFSTYRGISFKKLVACEGFYARENPYFAWLPFNPVKGETLRVQAPGLSDHYIVNQGNWSIPLGGGEFRWGATYVWHRLDWEPTQDGRDYIEKKIQGFYSGEYTVVDQLAGVRPTIKDRRPIMGPHPAQANLYILNGLGTKGVSLGPYLIHQWVDHLEFGKEILKEVTIERFYSLY